MDNGLGKTYLVEGKVTMEDIPFIPPSDEEMARLYKSVDESNKKIHLEDIVKFAIQTIRSVADAAEEEFLNK